MSRETDGYDGFLSRWSRRKSQANETPVNPATAEPAEIDPADQQLEQDLQATLDKAEAVNNADLPVSEIADDNVATQEPPEPLPDLETLTPESDFRPFMAGGVDKQIRNLALRKLFKAAVFGHRDGLDDYDEDFTTFEPLGNTVTADMRHHAERKERLAREAREEEEKLAAQAAGESTDEDGDIEATGSDDTLVADQDADANEIDESDQIRHSLDANASDESPTVMVGKLRRRPSPDDTANDSSASDQA